MIFASNMRKYIFIGLILILAGGTFYSCGVPKSGNSAVDKRKRKMGRRKMKRTELGCPMKDC